MDIVLPLGLGSRHNNMELRYCLRAVERYVPQRGNIFIIGERPAWLQNVIHVPATDNPNRELKEQNIFRKIVTACLDRRVSDNFIFFNDDHFLLQPWDFTYDHKGSLQEAVRTRKAYDTYRQTLINTLTLLGGGNNFDTHCPIIYNKDLFMRSVGRMDWTIRCGFGIKTLYCQFNSIEGRFYRDLKISRNTFDLSDLRTLITGRDYFSIADSGITPAMLTLLEQLYPKPSEYER